MVYQKSSSQLQYSMILGNIVEKGKRLEEIEVKSKHFKIGKRLSDGSKNPRLKFK
jgi:hypothetical protein